MYFEAELGVYFSAVMSWHSRKGLLSDRAGFRMMEVHEFLFRFELPFWKKALANSETSFPKTFESLDDIPDVIQRELKRKQVVAGIRAAYDELVKMSKFYFSPQNIFLILLLGKEGSCFCRALARLLTETICEDSDVSFLKEGWTLPETQTELENDFLRLLNVDAEKVVHWMRQHGLAKAEALTELRVLSQERPKPTRGLLALKRSTQQYSPLSRRCFC